MDYDFAISLGFLRLIYPDGPWMLTAISVDKKSIEARTFDSHELEEVLAWLSLHKNKNLYYSVNKPIDAAREKRKLSKTDVDSVHFLHVDVDPRTGEDVEAEQARILAQLTSYKITPSVIVFSGGGYNALWRLDTPFDVARSSPNDEETIARATDLERRNWQLELDFNTPDHCRDVSRILRLPGTINRPNAEKIAKGRVPALARIHDHNAHVYNLSTFMATPIVSSNTSISASKVTTNAVRLESLDHLKDIPDELKVIIAQGFDPKEPKKWEGDRSAALFFVCCELVRCNVPDEIILGIITDSRFVISASVIDKGSNVIRYATRQIERARDKAFHPKLAELNEKYALIRNFGGKAVVMRHGFDGPEFLRPREFCIGVDNEKIVFEVKGKEKAFGLGTWWLDQRRRRTFESVVYEPGQDRPGVFNLDTGLLCSPLPGDKDQRYLDHMMVNICGEKQEYYDYLLQWMARVVQTPRSQSESAIVLQGIRGTGKTLFVDTFGKLFGKHYMTVSDNRHLTGNFNAHLGRCVFVHADEAWHGRDIKHEGVLKTLITGQELRIEPKGFDVQTRPNYIHLMMSSNEKDAVPAGDHERRFFILNVGERNKQQTEYFAAMVADLESGGYAHLLHRLLSVDLTGFEVRRVPHTQALREAQEQNLNDDRAWLLQKLVAGDWLEGGARWEGPVEKKLLHADYLRHALDVKTRYPMGERAFHSFIMNEMPRVMSKQIRGRAAGHRPWVFCFPGLKECREVFDKARGWTYPWPEIPQENEEGEVIQLHTGRVFE